MQVLPVKSSHVDTMLKAREAKVLTWSLGSRLTFFAIFISLLILHLLGLINPGIVAQDTNDALIMLVILSGAVIFISLGMMFARREQHLYTVGIASILLDLIILAILPLVWYILVDLPGGSPAFLMKNELIIFAIVVMIINSIALRPLYPLLAGIGAIIIHFIIMWWVLSNPLVVVAPNFVDHFYTEAVNPGIFYTRIIVLALVSGFLTFLTWFARRNIEDAIELEIHNFEIKEQQAQLIHDSKMTAMSGLVAGVVHEVNNPLGVVKSSLATSEKCVTKLEGEIDNSSENPKVDRLFQLMRNNSSLANQGVERISSLVFSLKGFSRLDEAESQITDLRKDLDTVLTLVDQEVKGEVRVIREYENIPEIECKPREINQVFMTIILNAFEAMDGTGTLSINGEIAGEHVYFEISDTGPGIPEAVMSGLFEIGISSNKGRMSMGLGLPLAYKIVKEHGGELAVQSNEGLGTTFRIELPLETPDKVA